MELETSPFVFDGPVSAEDVIGRDAELAALRDRAMHGRFVLLYGPRRFGKTSLIHRLAAEADFDRDLAVVIADLLGVLTLDDISRRLADAYRRLPQGSVRKALTRAGAALAGAGVKLTAGAVSIGPPLRPQEATAITERLLDLPWEAARATGTRVLVVLDEFQAIGSVPNADAVIRSKIQHQRDHVSYLFAGSEQGMLRTIFDRRARPLYGQAEQFTLPPIPSADLAALIDRKFASTGRDPGSALESLLASVAGHPQRAMFLAHHLWGVVGPGGTGDDASWLEALERALRASTPEFTGTWTALTDKQRRVVRLLAYTQPLYGAAARRLELNKSTATRALAALVDDSIAVEEPPSLVDPLLGEWVRATQSPP